jgi:uncharacterized protein
MLEAIEKLIVLQDRDRKIIRLRAELAQVEPERQSVNGRFSNAQAALDAARLKVKQIETQRKTLELEAEALKQKIDKYSIQQFQTKKNDEYKMLGHEIDQAKVQISGLEDKQLDCMEQIEGAQKEVAAATKVAAETKAHLDRQLADLATREQGFKKELADLEAGRNQLALGIDEAAMAKYNRLLKTKGENCVVGIEHSTCGGCHMKLPTQVPIACKQAKELVTCPNCGRLLYFLHGMDLAAAE